MQRGQPDLPFGVIFQQYGDHLVVALLESNGQRGEAVLGEKVREENIQGFVRPSGLACALDGARRLKSLNSSGG